MDGQTGHTNGDATPPDAITSSTTTFDPSIFRSYLLALLPAVIDCTIEDLEDSPLFDNQAKGGGFDDKIGRFAGGPGAGAGLREGDAGASGAGGTSTAGGSALYVVKVKVQDDSADHDLPPTYIYHLTPHLTYNPSHVLTLALIKRHPNASLDPLTPLSQQLAFITLFGGGGSTSSTVDAPNGTNTSSSGGGAENGTPYESIHALVSSGIKPWFEAFVGGKESTSAAKETPGGDKLGIPQTKKKFAELELSLLHLQQNVEIPETHLIIHPVIAQAVTAAHAAGSRPNLTFIPPKVLTDSTFLNTLHGHVNTWIKSIQSVTKLTRDVSSGTASQEINFWLSLERALEGIETQLRSDAVLMVMDCLRNAKRFHATVSFIADTGLKDAMDVVHKYNILMRDLDGCLNELLSAGDLERVKEGVIGIFTHVNRKIKLSPYPVQRSLPLVEAISRDFNDQLLRILLSHRLIYTPYSTFDSILGQTQAVFSVWEEQVKEFITTARDMSRKRSEKFILIKVVPAHAGLQERTRYLREWRRQHEQLAVMTGRGVGGLGGSLNHPVSTNNTKSLTSTNGSTSTNGASGSDLLSLDMETEITSAYDLIKRIDAHILDVTPEGMAIWVQAEQAYNERIGRVEGLIIARLRDRLGTARNANEMFRVFERFNKLFVRPKIRGAIQEYQTQLIDSVKEDIKHLHDKFKTQYRSSSAYHMSQMRDLPPISGAIIWARQIERQLLTYMKRVEDVLGKGWEMYAEGQKLQSESSAFRKKLDTRPVFEAWLHDINRRQLVVGGDGKLFEIVRVRVAAAIPGTTNNNSSSNTTNHTAGADSGTATLNGDGDNTGINTNTTTITSTTNLNSIATNPSGSISSTAVAYQLAVNFDPQIITLFKEVRNLLWVGFQIPHAITNMAKDAKRVYPHAVSLMETVRTYGQTLDLVDRNRGIEWLVAEYRNECQRMVGRGSNIRWDYLVNQYDSTGSGRHIGTGLGGLGGLGGIGGRDNINRHTQFVMEFASVVSVLQDKTNSVIDLYKDVLRLVDDLATCSYTTSAFSDILGKIQTSIDKLNLEGYSNLDWWVSELDKKIEWILIGRLRVIVERWCLEFERSDDDAGGGPHGGTGIGGERERDRDGREGRRGDKRMMKDEKFMESHMSIKPFVHEIRIQNQVIFLDPPIEHARASWIRQLHDWLGVVCRLRRIQSSRYEIGLQMQGTITTETSYTSLLTHFSDNTLQRPFALIELKTLQLQSYVAKWLQFQSLWDLESESVFHRLGDSLAHWQQLLTEIKKARTTFDTSETQKSFGAFCIVDYEQVQARVNAKYDAWQREILGRFGVKLGNEMKEMHASILKARNELEHQSIEGLVGGPRRF